MSELDTEPTSKEKFMFLAMSMLHTRRNKTIEIYNELYAKTQKAVKLSPFERKQFGDDIDYNSPHIFNYKIKFDSFTKQSRYFLVSKFKPQSNFLADMMHRSRTELEAILIILALKRYAIENSVYPEVLQVLLDSGYITKLPMDPYSDKPLVYKKKDNDFILYSVGEDFEDNNGTPLFSGKRLKKWGNSNSKTGGDAVFWPVP